MRHFDTVLPHPVETVKIEKPGHGQQGGRTVETVERHDEKEGERTNVDLGPDWDHPVPAY